MDAIDLEALDADGVAGLLARSPFAEPLRRGAPLLVAALAPARIAFANPAALALFGTDRLKQINAVALLGASPGARRLRQLASGAAASAAKLELLRFYVDRVPVQLSLLCARLVDAQGRAYLVAAAPFAVRTEAEAAPQAPAPQSTACVVATAPPSRSERKTEPARFLWSMTDTLRFDASEPALVEAVGEAAPRTAEPFDAWNARTGIDADGGLARALASRATFGPLRLAIVPLGGPPADEAVIVALSGAPIFDRDRRFQGYRGFGIVTGETSRLAPPARPAETGAASSRVDPTDAPPPAPDEALRADAARSSRPEAVDQAVDGAGEAEARFTAERREATPATWPPYGAAPNVVPIRPGALRAPPLAEAASNGESVELTRQERDAFREIARALGARATGESAADLDESAPASSAPTHAGSGEQGDSAEAEPAGAAGARDDEAAARNARDLLDRLPIGALVARGDEALYLNRTLLDLLGYRDLVEFRAAAGLMRTFDGRALEQATPAAGGGALLLAASSGKTIPADGQIAMIDWDGAPATLVSLRRSVEADLTARTRALELEARASESQARELAAVLDTATDGVAILDAEGRIVSLSRPAEALFGLEEREVAGEEFLSLLAPDSRETVKAYFDGLRATGLASLLNDGREAVGRERQGRAIPLFITLGRISSSPDAKFCAVLRDMTQWKTIERDLEEARGHAEKASALKSEFLAKISHEIRTPLNAILGFAEVIVEERFGPVGNDRYKEYLKDIHASGAHVMSLINDLLDLSKIEAGKLDLNFAAIDANQIVQECVALMQPQAAHERIIVRTSLFDKLPHVIADERSLRQIMFNLMSNAVKFNEPGGQVIVSTAVNDSGQAVIRVRDTGIGMSEAELGAALEPFRQIATTRATRGTGLGLPLTKALVEANRAGFSIKSRKEQGTLVEVAFPTAQKAAE